MQRYLEVVYGVREEDLSLLHITFDKYLCLKHSDMLPDFFIDRIRNLKVGETIVHHYPSGRYEKVKRISKKSFEGVMKQDWDWFRKNSNYLIKRPVYASNTVGNI